VSSGISVERACVDVFHQLKSKREINTVIYRLSDDLTTVLSDFKGNLTHDELLQALPAAEPRFVVYELCFATHDGTRAQKTVLISWCPQGTTPEQRTSHSSGYHTLRNLLDGVDAYVEATDLTHVQYDELLSRTS